MGLNNVSFFALSSGIGDISSIDKRGETFAVDFFITLDGMDPEADVGGAVSGNRLYIEGVEARGFGTGVYFGFNSGEMEVRKSEPLFPSDEELRM